MNSTTETATSPRKVEIDEATLNLLRLAYGHAGLGDTALSYTYFDAAMKVIDPPRFVAARITNGIPALNPVNT